MSDTHALRLLEIVRTKLTSADARIEIGGDPPDDPRCVWATIGPHRRIVARFEEALQDAHSLREQLEALVAAFHDTAATTEPTNIRQSIPPQEAQTALDAELAALCVAAGAEAALVIDGSSPVVWGRSHYEIPASLDDLVELGEGLARLDVRSLLQHRTPAGVAGAMKDEALAARIRRRLEDKEDVATPAALITSAAAAYDLRARLEADPTATAHLHLVEGRGSGHPWVAYGIAEIYALLLTFGDRFSEIAAERSVRAVRSRLERLIGALPPVDPPPRRGSVVPLRKG